MLGSFSPSMRGVSPPAILFPITSNDDLQLSPKSSKVVGQCKNCSHSFRVNFTSSQEFCSKDCETCYTLFYNRSAPTSFASPKEKSTEDVRLSIYEFQRQIDAQDLLNAPPTTPVTPIKSTTFDYYSQDQDSLEDEFEVHKSEKKRAKAATASKATKSSKSRLGDWANRVLFTTPKPTRPQFQAFF